MNVIKIFKFKKTNVCNSVNFNNKSQWMKKCKKIINLTLIINMIYSYKIYKPVIINVTNKHLTKNQKFNNVKNFVMNSNKAFNKVLLKMIFLLKIILQY